MSGQPDPADLGPEVMTNPAKRLVREWVAKDGGDAERTARWMRDALRIGTLHECRRLVAEALR